MFKKLLFGGIIAVAGSVMANDGDLAAMKASLEKMQAEMAKRDAAVSAMSVELDALRNRERMAAGGEQVALTSANGKATIKIGGQVRVRYETGWTSAEGGHPYSKRVQSAGWGIQRVELNFGIKLSEDTSALISLRPSGGIQGGNFSSGGQILNQAYWDWNNIGGSGLGLRVGYQYVPFGGWTGEDGAWSWDGTFSGTNFYPFAASNGNNTINAADIVPVAIGAIARYKFLDDQLIVKAGVLGNDINNYSNATSGNNSGTNGNNELRNIGLVNHVVNIAYNPCYIEGLHLEAGYWGRFDDYDDYDKSATADVYKHLSRYSPEFNAQAYYKTGPWKVVAEWTGSINPRANNLYASTVPPASVGATTYFKSGFGQMFSGAIYYNVTEKFVVSGGADYAHISHEDGISGRDYHYENSAFQLQVGAGYTFSNGVIAQLGYRHLWTWRNGDGAPEGTNNTDTITFQTAYKF